MKTRFYRFAGIALYVVILSLGIQSTSWAHGKKSERIFFFGDSLSDAGNIFAVTGGQTAQPPYDLIPSRPYDIKGYQFSNGQTWAQRFAKSMKSKNAGKAALFAPGENGNYAFGGARARMTEDPDRAPSSQQQLGLYLSHYNGFIDPRALYVVQFGGNDIRDAISAFLLTIGPNPTDSELFEQANQNAGIIIQQAVSANVELISRLSEGGARNFLVVNAPDLGLTPAVRGLGLDASMLASMLSAAYNNGLAEAVSGIGASQDIDINLLDLTGIVSGILENPKSFKIKNTTSPCLIFVPFEDGSLKAWDHCKKPKQYLFWDGIHPTEQVHKIVGKAAKKIYKPGRRGKSVKH